MHFYLFHICLINELFPVIDWPLRSGSKSSFRYCKLYILSFCLLLFFVYVFFMLVVALLKNIWSGCTPSFSLAFYMLGFGMFWTSAWQQCVLGLNSNVSQGIDAVESFFFLFSLKEYYLGNIFNNMSLCY